MSRATTGVTPLSGVESAQCAILAGVYVPFQPGANSYRRLSPIPA